MVGNPEDRFSCDTAHMIFVVHPIKPNGLSHPDQMDESTFTVRGIWSKISFLYESHVSKQSSPRWDATFCGVTSGAILFAYVLYIGRQATI